MKLRRAHSARAESESERADLAERRAIAAEAAAKRAKAEIAMLNEERRRGAEAKSSSNENNGPTNGNENSVTLNVRENVQRALRANGYNIFESAEEMKCGWTGSAQLCKRPSGEDDSQHCVRSISDPHSQRGRYHRLFEAPQRRNGRATQC
ncbi:hypothetical protein [Ensifer adhaerens]|uniref:hypothetical protein n=1 Tax=Ensifer adhaerens TaxID=106592 RepID=UPI003F862034